VLEIGFYQKNTCNNYINCLARLLRSLQYNNKSNKIVSADDVSTALVVSTLVNDGNGKYTYTDDSIQFYKVLLKI
jgi:hypothetical protein